MSSFSDYLENAVLDYVFRNTGTPTSATVHVELYTAAPTDAGGGTVVTGGGYARETVTFGAASGGVISNSAPVAFTASGSNYSGAVVAMGIFDASSAGNLLAWDTITSATINDGDTLNFATSAISITLT